MFFPPLFSPLKIGRSTLCLLFYLIVKDYRDTQLWVKAQFLGLKLRFNSPVASCGVSWFFFFLLYIYWLLCKTLHPWCSTLLSFPFPFTRDPFRSLYFTPWKSAVSFFFFFFDSSLIQQISRSGKVLALISSLVDSRNNLTPCLTMFRHDRSTVVYATL